MSSISSIVWSFPFVIVGLAGLFAGVLEILFRFKPSNSTSQLLKGKWSAIYVIVNILAVLGVFFGSEASSATQITTIDSTTIVQGKNSLAAAASKAFLFGIVTSLAFRIKVEVGGVEQGPGVIVSKFLEYIETKINFQRSHTTLNQAGEIVKEADGVSPNQISKEVQPLCMMSEQTAASPRFKALQEELEQIMESRKNQTDNMMNLLLIVQMLREFEAKTIRKAIELVKGVNSQDNKVNVGSETLDAKLDSELEAIREIAQ